MDTDSERTAREAEEPLDSARLADDATAAFDDIDTDTDTTRARKPKRALWKRLLIAFAGLLLSLGVLAAVAYGFGSMMPPSAETKAAYETMRANGTAPEIEKQFHVPIPGCVCHSSDPVLQMQHSNRRIRDCMKCHG